MLPSAKRLTECTLRIALLLPFVLGSCTLSTFHPTVHLKMSTGAGRGSRGPALSEMKCFGVVVVGGPGAVAASQLSGRSPQCLGLDGTFGGPFTYAEVTSGVELSVPSGVYAFKIVGFHDVSSCGSDVSTLFPYANAASTYTVGTSEVVDVRTSAAVTVTSSYVSGTATNQTPLCPPAFTDCSGAEYLICDTFTETFTTVLSSHSPDIGTDNWAIVTAINPYVENNVFDLIGPNFASQYSAFTQNAAFNSTVTGSINFGDAAGVVGIRLNGRWTDTANHTFALAVRDTVAQRCSLKIVEVVGGMKTIKAEAELGADSLCAPNTNYDFTLRMNGYTNQATFLGHTIEDTEAAFTLVGTIVGMGAENLWATMTQHPTIDNFRVTSP